MAFTRSTWLFLAGLAMAGAAFFCAGITWGLPSRNVDTYLFGSNPVWTGEQIKELANEWALAPDRGADVDINPRVRQNRPVALNTTNPLRAEIIRRYRLFTHQPDEMVTMMALSSMSPGEGNFDPRLYQYGGLWIYPVGAMLKLASVIGLLELTPDMTFYLDRPEAFGRFYLVARLYVVVWATIGSIAVFLIVRRLTGACHLSAATATLCYIFMPIVVNAAHEAKPHLPGAVLMLLTVLSAMRYLDTGKRRWWMITGCVCGAALGMVLNAWPVVIVPLIMFLLRPLSPSRRLFHTLGTIGIAIGVYFATNPYVLINLVVNREVLRSNLANTRGMFQAGESLSTFLHAGRLIAQGTSAGLALAGIIGVILMMVQSSGDRHDTDPEDGHTSIATGKQTLWLLGGPALLSLLQFAMFAASQPAEYARFALFIDIAIGIIAVVTIRNQLPSLAARITGFILLVLLTANSGVVYLDSFIKDGSADNSRRRAADELLELQRDRGARSLGIVAEPAPYSVPPVDLFAWQLFLLPDRFDPKDHQLRPEVIVKITDSTTAIPDAWLTEYRRLHPEPISHDLPDISWANKHVQILYRKDLPSMNASRLPATTPHP